LKTFDSKKASERVVTEKSIEQAAVRYAKRLGFFTAKVAFTGHRGAHDRIFIKNRRVFFIEFKKLGEPASSAQIRFSKKMRGVKVDTYVCDDLLDAKSILFGRA